MTGNLPKPIKKQREVLYLPVTGYSAVLGTAGSGKTTLALYLSEPCLCGLILTDILLRAIKEKARCPFLLDHYSPVFATAGLILLAL